MKIRLLFFGVILIFFFLSCKKEPVSNAQINALPITLTIGTWWKYQRIDSSYLPGYFPSTKIDTSIEIITVIGQETYFNLVYGYSRSNSYSLDVKNLSKNTRDTIHAFFDSSSFYMVPHKDSFYLFCNLPLKEGMTKSSYAYYPYIGNGWVNTNSSIAVLNKTFEHCIYQFDSLNVFSGNRGTVHELKTYLAPGIGFVDWRYLETGSYYGQQPIRVYRRRLMDYLIAP